MTSDHGRRHITDICSSMYGVITSSDIAQSETQYEKCHFCKKKAFYNYSCQRENTDRSECTIVSNLVHISIILV